MGQAVVADHTMHPHFRIHKYAASLTLGWMRMCQAVAMAHPCHASTLRITTHAASLTFRLDKNGQTVAC
jgi:hypothetical protein